MAQKRKTQTKEKPKGRAFTFLLYPDSCPENFVELLEAGLDRPMAISPLHDKDRKELSDIKRGIEGKIKDINADVLNMDVDERETKLAALNKELDELKEYGIDARVEYKKGHYHVIYMASNPVTADSVRNKLKRVLGDKAVSHVKMVDNVLGLYLYLTHESKDAKVKGKHVYDKADIIHLNNFDIDRYIVLDEADKADALNVMIDFIMEFEIPNIKVFESLYRLKASDPHRNHLDSRLMRQVIKANTGLLKLYFDGCFQETQKQQTEQYNRTTDVE